MTLTPEVLTGQTRSHLTDVDGCLMHRDVMGDFLNLKAAAKSAGFELAVASSFRDFERQQLIWNLKFEGQRAVLDDNGQALDISTFTDREKILAILRWSALPGGSRHHWGTDLDIYAKNLLPEGVSLQLEPWEYTQGHQTPFADWLTDNLTAFGFYRPYQKDLGGVAVEPWHISHRETAQQYLTALTPALLSTVIASSAVAGREAVLAELDWIYSQYITNVSEA
ncbi:M15 family metallopeptidase [Enterovibrio paralichthyis]|uniref:M15 family metallopeptidase n=1 Tax=Enterovibrio paralichthyis TaxID=2853805 RepID=UPI001C46E236|nr:M15 family metallopeptidase [Enterovibrio paralichthyis]MBV7298470.1 M15 family metallopeptidase [Enterovibrio paralichthyis]